MSYSQSYSGHNTPSAPPVPEPEPGVAYPYQSPSNYYGQSQSQNPSSYGPPSNHHSQSHSQNPISYGSPSNHYGQSHSQNPISYGSPSNHYGQSQSQNPSGYGSYGYPSFPAGTQPEVIRSFQMADRDRSGFIDEKELQQALSSGYQRFSLRTIRLLMFLFKSPNDALRSGPKEFAELWSCLGQWRAIFERFDRDRSGKIDASELKDAFYSLGYAIPPSVLQVLISRYDDGSGRRVELSFDSFVECGMIVKGLTEKFKEKDLRYTGSATLTYDTFMSMIIPFLV